MSERVSPDICEIDPSSININATNPVVRYIIEAIELDKVPYNKIEEFKSYLAKATTVAHRAIICEERPLTEEDINDIVEHVTMAIYSIKNDELDYSEVVMRYEREIGMLATRIIDEQEIYWLKKKIFSIILDILEIIKG